MCLSKNTCFYLCHSRKSKKQLVQVLVHDTRVSGVDKALLQLAGVQSVNIAEYGTIREGEKVKIRKTEI